MKAKPFNNVKNQIGFCGIWCGSCPGGNGVTIELTKRYEEIVKKYSLEEWVPKDFDFKEFMKGIASIQTMPMCPGCLKGGGDPTCRVRICAQKKNITNCSQCDQLMACENFEKLEGHYPEIKKSLSRNKDIDSQKLIEKWTSELKRKFPHCILLCDASFLELPLL